MVAWSQLASRAPTCHSSMTSISSLGQSVSGECLTLLGQRTFSKSTTYRPLMIKPLQQTITNLRSTVQYTCQSDICPHKICPGDIYPLSNNEINEITEILSLLCFITILFYSGPKSLQYRWSSILGTSRTTPSSCPPSLAWSKPAPVFWVLTVPHRV